MQAAPHDGNVFRDQNESNRQHPQAEHRENGEEAAEDQEKAGRDARPARFRPEEPEGGASDPAREALDEAGGAAPAAMPVFVNGLERRRRGDPRAVAARSSAGKRAERVAELGHASPRYPQLIVDLRVSRDALRTVGRRVPGVGACRSRIGRRGCAAETLIERRPAFCHDLTHSQFVAKGNCPAWSPRSGRHRRMTTAYRAPQS